MFYAPLISPVRQVATVGSDVLFTCDKPQSAPEPAGYRWFVKHDNEDNDQHEEEGDIDREMSFEDVNSIASTRYER